MFPLQFSHPVIEPIVQEMKKVIVGQDILISRLLIALICKGHILLEGPPGLAKTTAISTLAGLGSLEYKRIQFTPDLLPSDIVGAEIYSPKTQEFLTKKGPIFTNLLLADEINRCPPKVQAALLESMQERQVTIGEISYKLPHPFFVLATQNPLEHEGTYPLPEAQLDRFMMKTCITYPSKEEELEIILKNTKNEKVSLDTVLHSETLEKLSYDASQIYIDDHLKQYIIDIIFAFRDPKNSGIPQLQSSITHAPSPRASIALIKASQALALIQGREFVLPEDVKEITPDILRHRIGLSYEAESKKQTPDTLINHILNTIRVP